MQAVQKTYKYKHSQDNQNWSINNNFRSFKPLRNSRFKAPQDDVDISSLDTDRYWNIIDEEEKQGNSFIDIAKDIADIEKGVIFSYFSWVDENGKPYDSFIKCIPSLLIIILIAGCFVCAMERLSSILSQA